MTDGKPRRIVHLIDAPDAAPVLAAWFVAEWAPWYGPGGGGDAEGDLAACRDRDALPICLVALGEAGEPLGTAALKAESVGGEIAPGPWLAALLLGTNHRGRGIASALVEAIEAEARRLGIAAVYTSTDTAAGIMARRGWQPVGETDSLRGRITVYRRSVEEPRR